MKKKEESPGDLNLLTKEKRSRNSLRPIAAYTFYRLIVSGTSPHRIAATAEKIADAVTTDTSYISTRVLVERNASKDERRIFRKVTLLLRQSEHQSSWTVIQQGLSARENERRVGRGASC